MKRSIGVKKTIASRSEGENFPALNITRRQPDIAAAVSKLIPSRMPPRYDQKGNQDVLPPDIAAFRETGNLKTQAIIDSKLTMQMLPDIDVASQILISMVLSPKDMTTLEINYQLGEDILPPEVASLVIDELADYFDKVYKIKDKLPRQLKDILFRTGSYPVAVLPENAIDEIINGVRTISNESLDVVIDNRSQYLHNLGVLGPSQLSIPTAKSEIKYTTESFTGINKAKPHVNPKMRLENDFTDGVDTHITITDNIQALKLPLLYQRTREQKIRNVVSPGLEDISTIETGGEGLNPHGVIRKMTDDLNDREIRSLFYKGRRFHHNPVVSLKTQNQLNRYTVGEPLVLHLPSESVIPVHVPGRPEEKIGMFVILDAEGYPLSQAGAPDEFRRMQMRMNSTTSFASSMLNKVKNQQEGFDFGQPRTFDYCAAAYGDFIERDLTSRLRNGMYDNGVALARNTEIYRIMLARSLQEQNTQLLFIPIEFASYMAFDYDDNGLGKSLLDDARIVNSMRVMTQMADTMAAIRNSIGRTDVQVKLDPDDPDPNKSKETIIHEIARSRVSSFPLGANTVADMVDGIMRAGIEIHVTGHPGLPDYDVTFTEKSTNYPKVDQDLRDNLRKQSIMSTGVTPEMVDSAYQPEFATIFTENNVIMAKRATMIQDMFMSQETELLKRIVVSSGNLYGRLAGILIDNFDTIKKHLKNRDDLIQRGFILSSLVNYDDIKEQQKSGEKIEYTSEMLDKSKTNIVEKLLSESISSLEASLPRPTSVSLDRQMESYGKYKTAVEEALNAYFDNSSFTDQLAGQSSEQLESIKNACRDYFLRQYLSENGILPEVTRLTAASGAGGKASDAFVDAHNRHVEVINKIVTEIFEAAKKTKEKTDDKLEKLGIQAPSAFGGFGGEPESDDTDPFGGGGDLDDSAPQMDQNLDGSGEETDNDQNNDQSQETSETDQTNTNTTDEVDATKTTEEDDGSGGTVV